MPATIKWPDRPLFNQQQIEYLRDALRLTHSEEDQIILLSYIKHIYQLSAYVKLDEEARLARKYKNVKDAERYINRISSASKDLINLIKKDNDTVLLLLSKADAFPPVGVSFDGLDRFYELQYCLEILSQEAFRIALNKDFIKQFTGLVPVEQPNKSPITARLWPELFRLWEYRKFRVGFSENGPLQRFVSLIHKAAEWPDPNPEELKQAVAEWRSARATELRQSRSKVGRGQSSP